MSRDRRLPIFEIEEQFRAALVQDHSRIIVEAPTGSGKSTQIPSFLRDSGCCGEGEIIVLQPRRLAARLLASRVASERGGRLGEEVGYQVRFESADSAATRIRFVTEGILIRRLVDSPTLNGVAAVVLDEFHERHFFGDISLARCLALQAESRPDLKIVVMSATLETVALRNYLGVGCHHLISAGRTFPVEVLYEPARERHRDEVWDHAVRALGNHLKSHGIQGHVLIFMPGRYEIQRTVDCLRRASWSRAFQIHELYGELSPDKQDAAVAPGDEPRIVVATNVAETSITIDGVRVVIDAGLERRAAYDHRRDLSTLHIVKISQASADQRAGRAGRTGPGTAIRLWSQRDQEGRATATPAEIQRMDLSEAILILLGSGVTDLVNFAWFEKPDPLPFASALERLRSWGAIDDQNQLTKLGRSISQLPLPPRFGAILHEAALQGYADYVAVLIALTQARPMFPNQKRAPEHLMPADFVRDDDRSDFQALVRAWRQLEQNQFRREVGERLGIHAGAARDIGRIADQLRRLARRWSHRSISEDPESETLAKILLGAYADRLALRLNENTLACAVVGGRRGQVDKESLGGGKESRLFLASDIMEIEGKDLQVKLSLTTVLEEAWLKERFPNDFQERAGAVYDERERRIEARKERRFRDLVLESRVSGEPPLDQAAALLAERVRSGELIIKAWDEKVDAFFARIALVAEFCPDEGLSPIDDDARQLILEQICAGATSYKQIKDRPVWPTLDSWLTWNQRQSLDRLAPERVVLSTGRDAKIVYRSGEKPRIAVLIQHLFGRRDAPRICRDQIPLVIEILAPNHRPVQVTEDLASFWTGSYPAVRTQLRGRYPKHEWPEY